VQLRQREKIQEMLRGLMPPFAQPRRPLHVANDAPH
jgi:hypothetical protein